MEIVLPRRRFAIVRRILREYAPAFYGWMLGNVTLRRAFNVVKGQKKIIVEGDPAEKFTAIYETHFWVDDESRSGGGSNLYETENIRRAIPVLFSKCGVRSVVDVPCGDFFWFKELPLDLDCHIGGDIVAPLIQFVIETGSFHSVNLYSPPFNFPPALEMIDDYAKGQMPRQLGL